MKNPIATCKLWCLKGDAIVEFDVTLGAPYREGDMWCCEWSVGLLEEYQFSPGRGVCSMHDLTCSQVKISGYLRGCQKNGDRFYMEPDIMSKELENLDLFFPRLKIDHDKRPVP